MSTKVFYLSHLRYSLFVLGPRMSLAGLKSLATALTYAYNKKAVLDSLPCVKIDAFSFIFKITDNEASCKQNPLSGISAQIISYCYKLFNSTDLTQCIVKLKWKLSSKLKKPTKLKVQGLTYITLRIRKYRTFSIS